VGACDGLLDLERLDAANMDDHLPLRQLAWDRYWSEVYRAGNERPGAFTRWSERILRTSHARTVVDLGCGPGRDLCFLLTRGFSVVGVDISSVATGLAAKAVSRLPPEVAERGRVVHGELLDFLATLPPGSVDAVHAAATYQGLSDDEAVKVFREIHRVLGPRGLHLWSVRTDRHTGGRRPASVPPNFAGLGFTVPLRFFARDEVERLTATLFDHLEIVETPEPSSFRIADRKSIGSGGRPP